MSKTPQTDGDVAVRVLGGFGGYEDIVVRLLSVVFTTLAEAGCRKSVRSV